MERIWWIRKTGGGGLAGFASQGGYELGIGEHTIGRITNGVRVGLTLLAIPRRVWRDVREIIHLCIIQLVI